MPKRFSFLTWIVLSLLVAAIELDTTAMTSEAFRQYLRDLPLLSVYRNLLGAMGIYAVVGGIGWVFVGGLFLLGGKKGRNFFLKNTGAAAIALFLTVYGSWALQKFFFRRGILDASTLGVLTLFVALLATFLAWGYQRFFSLPLQKKLVGVILFFTLFLPLSFRFSFDSGSAPPSIPNLILLSVDTLRPDRLGAWGYAKARTPHIDRLASQGLRWDQAYAQIPLTAPSFSSILTGLYPKSHGCRANLTRLDPSVTTLAEVLRESGYQTAAFVSGYPLKQELCGLAKGFHLYQDRFSFFDGLKLLRFLERFGLVELQLERRAPFVSRLFIPWMKRHKGKPFFVWIHYYDPHVPYRPPQRLSDGGPWVGRLRREQRDLWGKGKEVLSPETISAMEALYDGEIAYVDEDIGRTLSFLEKEGLREKSLILFVSDHGESFDHDYYFDHGDRLYESSVRIPVIFSYADLLPEGAVSDKILQSVDLFPTILSLLNVPGRKSDGESVWKGGKVLLDKKSPFVYAELSRRSGYPTLGDLWSLREGSWKLIYSPEGRPPELYHLSKDPGETRNLSFQETERVKRMTKQVIQWMGEKRKKDGSIPVKGLAREKLKSLGYLQ